MRPNNLALALALLVAFGEGANVARAQDYEAAGRHFAAAQQAFGKGHFKKAATEFEAAHDISKDPVLLLHIGESWDKAGEPKRAVDYYRRYVSEQPQASDRTKVELRIRELEELHHLAPPPPEPIKTPPAPHLSKSAASEPPKDAANAPQDAPPPPPEPPPPPPEPVPATAEPPATPPGETPNIVPPPAPVAPPPAPPGGLLDEDHPSGMRIGAWVAVAATVALLASGAICGLAAQERADEITHQRQALDPSGQPALYDAALQQRYNDNTSEGKLYNGLAIGLMSAAGAAAIVSTTLFLLDRKHAQEEKKRNAERSQVQLLPAVSAHGGGLSATFEF